MAYEDDELDPSRGADQGGSVANSAAETAQLDRQQREIAVAADRNNRDSAPHTPARGQSLLQASSELGSAPSGGQPHSLNDDDSTRRLALSSVSQQGGSNPQDQDSATAEERGTGAPPPPNNAGADASGGVRPRAAAHAAGQPPMQEAAGDEAEELVVVSGDPNIGFTTEGHEFLVRCTRPGDADQGLGFTLKRCLLLGRVVYLVDVIHENGRFLKLRQGDIFVSAGYLEASDLIPQHVHASKRQEVLLKTLGRHSTPVDLKFLRQIFPNGGLRSVKDAVVVDGISSIPRNNQFQSFDIEYDNNEKHMGFRLVRQRVHGMDVFVAVRIDQSDREQICMLQDYDVLVKVDGKRLNLYAGPIIPIEERADALTSIVNSISCPKTLTIKRFPRNAVFSDPPQPPAPQPDGRKPDYTNPIPIGSVKLLPDEGAINIDDENYRNTHSVFVKRCYTDKTAEVQYVFPSTELNRIVPIEDLVDLAVPLNIPAARDGQNNPIVGKAIPAFDEDVRSRRTKKRKAKAAELQDASAEDNLIADTLVPPNRHRRQMPDATIMTDGKTAHFRLALAEVSNESLSAYDSFGLKSSAGDILDPPSGHVQFGFFRGCELNELQPVHPPGQQQANPQGQPPGQQQANPQGQQRARYKIDRGRHEINGHAYIERNDSKATCKRNTAGRKWRCGGRARVVDGQCTIVNDHANFCNLASLIEGGVVRTPEQIEAADLELLHSDRSYYDPISVRPSQVSTFS